VIGIMEEEGQGQEQQEEGEILSPGLQNGSQSNSEGGQEAQTSDSSLHNQDENLQNQTGESHNGEEGRQEDAQPASAAQENENSQNLPLPQQPSPNSIGYEDLLNKSFFHQISKKTKKKKQKKKNACKIDQFLWGNGFFAG